MRVKIDARRCISSGYCVMEAPAVFARDDEGLVVLLVPDPPRSQHAAARAAELACPAAVITVTDEASDAA